MGRLVSICVVALVVTFSAWAQAKGDADLGEDLIRLKDGGMLRGTIVAVEPNKEATIVVGGKEKTIPWSKIAKVEQGKYKTQDSAKDEEEEDEDETPKPKKKKKKKPARDEDEELTEPEQGAPLVHIAATYPNVQLTKVVNSITVVGSGGSATGVVSRGMCTAPCDEIINGRDGSQFFFSAPGMVPSPPFSLKQYDGEIEARVRGGSIYKRGGGMVLSGLGLATVLTGVFLTAMPGETPDFRPDGEVVYRTDSRAPGLIILGVGAVALAGGIFMWVTSGTTFEIRPRDSESAGIRIENGVLRF